MSDYKYYTPVALLDALLEYLSVTNIHTVVDISCGSFNLLKSALKRFPKAKCVGVDIESQNIKEGLNIKFIQQDGRIFAKSQKEHGKGFDLILSNPPFGRLKKSDRLFENEKDSILCSRYECEMMYANSMLAKEKAIMIAILPATFVEGDLYKKYRIKIAKEFKILSLIKLPGDVFSRGSISSYAIAMQKTSNNKSEDTRVGTATYVNEQWAINTSKQIGSSKIILGTWIEPCSHTTINQKSQIDDIFRGNVSSKFFSSEGLTVLHCSSSFCNGKWQPSQRFCNIIETQKCKYVQDGDIIINRIGNNAGFWTKYQGEEQLISDCLIVVRGGNNIETFLSQHSINGRLEVPIKGVATPYISISDITSLFFEIKEDNK